MEVVEWIRRYFPKRKIIYIDDYILLPSYRGKGNGKRLMEFMIKNYIRDGVGIGFVDFYPKPNIPSMSVLSSLGFCFRRKMYESVYEDGINSLLSIYPFPSSIQTEEKFRIWEVNKLKGNENDVLFFDKRKFLFLSLIHI